MPRTKVFFDGGCRPAPHGVTTAVVVRGVAHIAGDMGPGTSMDAEWLALIRAVETARQLGLSDPLILGDALAVIAQATGVVKVRPPFAAHLAALRSAGPLPRIRYIKRTQNLAGIALERLRA